MTNSFSKKAAILFGWEKFKEHAQVLLGVFATIGAISFVFDKTDKLEVSILVVIVLGVVGFALQTILNMGAIRIVLDIYAGKEVKYGGIISERSLWWKFILAEILTAVVVAVGLIFLIVPGVIAAIGFFFVQYIVIDKKLGPVDALKDSWRLAKGHKWNLFLFAVLIILVNIAGLIALGIGLLVSVPVSFLATVYVYKWLDRQDTPVVQTQPANAEENE